jgi:transposase
MSPCVSRDPFHVVRLAGERLEKCHRPVKQDTLGHCGGQGDPLFQARRTLYTGEALVTDRQRERLKVIFTPDEHAQIEATWGARQRIITANRHPDPRQGKQLMQAVVYSFRECVPTVLKESRKLGRTLNSRAADVLAYFESGRGKRR